MYKLLFRFTQLKVSLTTIENVTWSVNYGAVSTALSHAVKCGKVFECCFSIIASSTGGKCEIVIPLVLSSKFIMGIARNTGTGVTQNITLFPIATNTYTVFGATLPQGYDELRFQCVLLISN